MRTVFVDSSAWIALYDPSDQYHAAIVPVWQQLAEESVYLITTDYVLDEVYTHLRRRVGLPACVAFHNLVVSSSVLRVVDVAPSVRQAAWSILVKHEDKVLSFTDCASFAVMTDLGMHDALTFDRHFRQVGFVSLP